MLTCVGVLMSQWSRLKPAHLWLKTVQIHLRHFTITEVALREFVDENIPHSIIIIEYSIIIPNNYDINTEMLVLNGNQRFN